MQRLMRQNQKQQEALRALQVRMEAVEAHQRRSWAQRLWYGRVQKDSLSVSSEGSCLVMDDSMDESSNVTADSQAEQTKPVRGVSGVESIVNFLYRWNETAE